MKKKLLALALVPFLSGCGLGIVHGPPSGWQAIQDVDALETMALTQPCTTSKGVLFLDWGAAALFVLLAGIAVEDVWPSSSQSDEIGLGMGAASLGIGGLYAFSALKGNGRVNDCRAFNARLMGLGGGDAVGQASYESLGELFPIPDFRANALFPVRSLNLNR
jgi:hypothetical protein